MKTLTLVLGLVAMNIPYQAFADVIESFRCDQSINLQTGQGSIRSGDTVIMVEVTTKVSPAGNESQAGAYSFDISNPQKRHYFGMMDDLTIGLGTEIYRPSTQPTFHTEFSRTGTVGILTMAVLLRDVHVYENIVSYLCRKIK